MSEEQLIQEKDDKLQRWEARKQQIYLNVASIVGPNKAKAFINYYSKRYDPWMDELLDWRLAMTLFDDYHYCKRVGTRWYACVGSGGTGKSTIMQNIFYFLDPKFKLSESNLNVKDFINNLGKEEMLDGMRAQYMDEPDDDIHPQTPIGKKFRKILGKARQAQFFFGICATDMSDIPPYIFRKIDVILFTPKLGSVMVIKNKPRLKRFPIQYIRKEYLRKGYQVFYEVSQEFGCINAWTAKAVPFTDEEKKEYLKSKWKDLQTDIKDTQKLLAKEDGGLRGDNGEKLNKVEARKEMALLGLLRGLRAQGKSYQELSKLSGYTVGVLRNKLSDNKEEVEQAEAS